ncbi:PEP phosphonomutase [Paenibacillus odorifer]|uniref:PEP phosphonomutase n=1 Tax=Paenibacillus odorifer TaxID=189426 RepID=A0A1R0ZEW8_9BACL|nr:isocitrate lyase/phosphoenolpyruvate mutase family protein [Paenibacillus odorifer]OMD48253.1 PEP phosphonomutase [Paenibacillus odorifer]OME68477.1 PEP phosphonomutase [Paenibacillus odorifer]
MNRNDYDYFKSLHDQENPLMLYNCWDVASAKAIEKAGSKAIATSSFAMADAWGYSDGEQLSFEQLLWAVTRIAEHVSVPLTVDIEGGYAVNEESLANNIEQLFQLDICGINFEDQKVNHPDDELWAIEEQSHRIRTIQQVAAKLQKKVFINARTDLFFKNGKHSLDLVNEAIERTCAYAAAGADGIFIPGLTDRNLIEYFVQQSPLPVNVMVMDGMISNAELQELGVKRISYGPYSYFQAQHHLQDDARSILQPPAHYLEMS